MSREGVPPTPVWRGRPSRRPAARARPDGKVRARPRRHILLHEVADLSRFCGANLPRDLIIGKITPFTVTQRFALRNAWPWAVCVLNSRRCVLYPPRRGVRRRPARAKDRAPTKEDAYETTWAAQDDPARIASRPVCHTAVCRRPRPDGPDQWNRHGQFQRGAPGRDRQHQERGDGDDGDGGDGLERRLPHHQCDRRYLLPDRVTVQLQELRSQRPRTECNGAPLVAADRDGTRGPHP